jgi:hypothetical protein
VKSSAYMIPDVVKCQIICCQKMVLKNGIMIFFSDVVMLMGQVVFSNEIMSNNVIGQHFNR